MNNDDQQQLLTYKKIPKELPLPKVEHLRIIEYCDI